MPVSAADMSIADSLAIADFEVAISCLGFGNLIGTVARAAPHIPCDQRMGIGCDAEESGSAWVVGD